MSLQEVHPKKSYLSTITGALKLYYFPESLRKNNDFNLITEEKAPKEKDVELDLGIDLKNLINDYLEKNKKNKHEVFIYYEKPVEPIQYNTTTKPILLEVAVKIVTK
ncbi:hypothetical protein C2G38_2210423 [Gigaspora rosea]|uniref:Uncharacterized protein n=1 Tax=Gigaspora rosea TaxID=44941 RepID=A0A397UI46_9GLOM|nr:hypothetical protein C2G38_2210423 [Gigaspora rosea]